MQPALWPWFDQWIFREEVFSQGSNIWRRREHLNDLCIDAKGLFYQQCHESGNGTYRSWETGLKSFVTAMSSGGSDKKAPLDQRVRWLSCQPRHHDHHQGNDGNAGNVKEAKQKKEKNKHTMRARTRPFLMKVSLDLKCFLSKIWMNVKVQAVMLKRNMSWGQEWDLRPCCSACSALKASGLRLVIIMVSVLQWAQTSIEIESWKLFFFRHLKG